ncbi:MAG: permease [Parvularculaceae bacterium]|nr:MAG: permease [Parvularculaceae bacterium]
MRRVTLVFFIGFLVLTTWPGFTLLNRPTPFILGLPFNLFALVVLIIAGMGVLFALYLSERDR